MSHVWPYHAWLRDGLGWEPSLFRLFSLPSFSGTDVTFLGDRIRARGLRPLPGLI